MCLLFILDASLVIDGTNTVQSSRYLVEYIGAHTDNAQKSTIGVKAFLYEPHRAQKLFHNLGVVVDMRV